MKYFIVFIIAYCLFFVMSAAHADVSSLTNVSNVVYATASSLMNVSDTVSRLKAEEPANHTIQFTIPSGMNGGAITIFFNNAVSDINGVDYTDIDLLYGPLGRETEKALYVQPGTNVWGVTVNPILRTITLNYPIVYGFPILTGERVIIKIGTHALDDMSPA